MEGGGSYNYFSIDEIPESGDKNIETPCANSFASAALKCLLSIPMISDFIVCGIKTGKINCDYINTDDLMSIIDRIKATADDETCKNFIKELKKENPNKCGTGQRDFSIDKIFDDIEHLKYEPINFVNTEANLAKYKQPIIDNTKIIDLKTLNMIIFNSEVDNVYTKTYNKINGGKEDSLELRKDVAEKLYIPIIKNDVIIVDCSNYMDNNFSLGMYKFIANFHLCYKHRDGSISDSREGATKIIVTQKRYGLIAQMNMVHSIDKYGI
jgi:hypothetical protein